jgi:hypothetical protein
VQAEAEQLNGANLFQKPEQHARNLTIALNGQLGSLSEQLDQSEG